MDDDPGESRYWDMVISSNSSGHFLSKVSADGAFSQIDYTCALRWRTARVVRVARANCRAKIVMIIVS